MERHGDSCRGLGQGAGRSSGVRPGSSFMNRDWIQRHRLKFVWALIALLLAFLAVRAGFAQWRELSQWRGLAEQAAGLQGGPGLNLERLRQSAQARRIELAEV